jgi:hypothetical protein
MLRLTIVFLVWIASTAYPLDDADPDYDSVDKYERSYYSAAHASRGKGSLSSNQR